MTSCEEKGTNEDELPDRAFRPIKFTRSTPFEDEITFEWVPFANCTYQFEISRDSMEFTRDLKTYSLEGVNEFKLDGLWCGARYSVRMKTISKDVSISESDWAYTSATSPTFLMPSLGIIVPNSISVSIDESSLSWNPKKQVDRLSILVGTVEVESFTITPAEQEAGTKTVTATLAPETLHTFRLYYGNTPRGEVRASTPVAPKSVVIPDEFKDLILGVGKKKTLTATVLPEIAYSKEIFWSSEDPTIADIDPETGELIALSEGWATINVPTVIGGHEATCAIKIIDMDTRNLLLNGKFLTTFPNDETWKYVPLAWFETYYTNVGADEKTRYSNTELARNDDHVSANAPSRIKFWRDLGIATGPYVFRFNENRIGGIYQNISVTPGSEYMFRFDLAFCRNNAEFTAQMESVKILHTDGTKIMEFPLPKFEYTVFEIDYPSGQAYRPQGGYFEVVERFTVPAGVNEIRFQLDQRTFIGGVRSFTPRTYINDCSLFEMPDF